MKNKLFLYLDKINVDYRPIHIGHNYFYNVAPLVCDAAIVSFDYTVSPADCMKADQRYRMIERYAARYGYKIYNRCGFTGYRYFYITSVNDYNDVEFMSSFVNRSVSACEKLIHLYHTGKTVYKTDIELNRALKRIMDYFGRYYKRCAFSIVSA